jgi:hypothetical protein
MMIIIFWEMTPCGSYKNWRFGGSYRLHLQGVRLRTNTEWSGKLLYRQRLNPIQELTTSLCVCSQSYTLKMEAIQSSETSVLIRATWRHLPEDDNHHSHRHGNLKSYIMDHVFLLQEKRYKRCKKEKKREKFWGQWKINCVENEKTCTRELIH